MKAESARKFLACLRVFKTEEASGWVNSSCPLAFLHKGGHDHNPSFGIRLDTGTFNCFSCGAKGSLSRLLSLLVAFSDPKKYDIKGAYDVLRGIESDLVALPEYLEFQDHKVFQEWPEQYLHEYPTYGAHEEAIKYLKGVRDIPFWLCDQMDLRWDSYRQMVVFPYRNAFGKLAGMRGRCIHPDYPKKFQHKDYKYHDTNNAKLTWYNEPALQNDGPIIVVEGQIDCLRLLQVTPNVVANMTALITKEKLMKLTAKEQVIFMMDNDETGQTAVHGNSAYPGAIKLLEGHDLQIAVLDYPAEYKDPDKVPLDWLRKELKGVVPFIAGL